jgi:hypothetical protein
MREQFSGQTISIMEPNRKDGKPGSCVNRCGSAAGVSGTWQSVQSITCEQAETRQRFETHWLSFAPQR